MKYFKRINYLIIFLIVFAFFAVGEIKADVSDNMAGYAWSENIGWISFNCTNEDSCLTSSYGVDVDEITGIFSGYAWAGGGEDADGTPKPTIGWIAFADYNGDGDDTNDKNIIGSPCAPNCEAKISTTTGEVSGWARALAHGGGWDGWIKLRGWTTEAIPTEYGVSLNTTPDPSEFEGFAWGGGTVVDSISFNHLNCDPVPSDGFSDGIGACPIAGTPISDYKVTTTASFAVPNSPPVAVISCNPGTCQVYYEEVLILNNNSTDLDGDAADIAISQWYLKKQGEPDTAYALLAYCDCRSGFNCVLPNCRCNCTPQSVAPDDYTIKLYVEDVAGESSEAVQNFTIKKDAEAGFVCSLSSTGPWIACGNTNFKPSQGEVIYFSDSADCSEECSAASEGASITSRIWEQEGIGFGSNNSLASTTMAQATTTIKLTIGDSVGRGDSKEHIIGAKASLPKWKEVSPIILLKNFLADISDFLNELVSL